MPAETNPEPINRARLDAQGRIIPLTPEEQEQFLKNFHEGMARLRAIPDDPDEDDREFWAAMDSHNPDAPYYKGIYFTDIY